MDLSNINIAAKKAYPPTKKMVELDPSLLYTITILKTVNTRYGKSVVIVIDGKFSVFLPACIVSLLLNDTEIYAKLLEAANAGRLQLKYLGRGTECEFKYN